MGFMHPEHPHQFGLERIRNPKAPGGKFGGENGWPRWMIFVLVGGVLMFLLLPQLLSSNSGNEINYGDFMNQLTAHQLSDVSFDNTTGKITGTVINGNKKFTSNGPLTPSDADLKTMTDERREVRDARAERVGQPVAPAAAGGSHHRPVRVDATPRQLADGRRHVHRPVQGQDLPRSSGPGTTFADVAGYEGVKQEITEVVDFLKYPEKFAEIGARIPKGVLLVGPPGTGKTLLARAVAGEAGVPFLSVTGSDFMEMFVGVGASRVRDLFQTARKMGRAIIFVDEIDSIGRKRGAGLGGGHDEREQTLNQMLSEMDGFEVTTGIVMMAATNRPDILDPALLRPGRFDRQVVVPLPELEDRRQILDVHCKHKRIAPDVDLDLVARGTPGMSGADLDPGQRGGAVRGDRHGENQIEMKHLRRGSRPGAHEPPGARVDRVVRPREGADRLPRGRPRRLRRAAPPRRPGAQGHDHPPRHGPRCHPATAGRRAPQLRAGLPRRVDRVVAMGGRIAEKLVFDVLSTGASNDLVVSTERARKMVREWGMSERIGPMAWGSQGQVFLGDDLMHTRDYSDDTARVIDEEVETILREAEDQCEALLTENRKGLDLVARALLKYETIDGSEVTRLIQLAGGGGASMVNTGSKLSLGRDRPVIPDHADLSNLPSSEPTPFNPTDSTTAPATSPPDEAGRGEPTLR